MTPTNIDWVETHVTPAVAKKMVENFSEEEKNNMIAACSQTSEQIAENMNATPDTNSESVEKIEVITEGDIKLTYFGNTLWFSQWGEEGMCPFWEHIYDGSKASKEWYVWEMKVKWYSDRRLYRISYPSLEHNWGRRWWQAWIGIELNPSFSIAPEKVIDTLWQIFQATLIKNWLLKRHENKNRTESDPEQPYCSRQRRVSSKEFSDLATRVKKSLVDWLNREPGRIIKVE